MSKTDERNLRASREKLAYLRLVDAPSTYDVANEADPATEASMILPAQKPHAQALMYACMSWVALVMERGASDVTIQPLEAAEYECSVRLTPMADGVAGRPELVVLRALLIMEPGKVLHLRVESARP